MPIYEYECTDCHERFEHLLRGDDKPECPSCGGTNLEKQMSTPAAPQMAGGGAAACDVKRGERPCDISGGGGCNGCPCSMG